MKRYGLAILLMASAACVSFAFKPLLSDFPAFSPILFLLSVVIAARYIDFAASIVTLCGSTVLLSLFYFSATPREPLTFVSLAKTAAFAVIGAFVCYLIRSLRDARASRARLAEIVESSDDAIVSSDLDGTVTSWNASATRMYGYTADEMIGHSIFAVVPKELHGQQEAILRNIREGKRLEHFETERVRKDGAQIKVSLTISPLLGSRGRVVGVSKIARDITERVKMREAFIESEKLAATGRMAAAIAHEINNPLEAVTNLAYLLSTNANLDETGKQYAEMLLSEIHRVSNVAKRSLTFFRDTGKPAAFDLGSTLEGVLELNRPVFAQKNITVQREYSGEYLVFGSSAEMRQVFSNLVRNAIDAVAEGGEIRIRARAGAKGRWRVSIADNGNGISPESKARLFQPFATTKGSAGNGLGLWISRGIVEKHGGTIQARSANSFGNRWTVFSVVLPAHTVVANETAATLEAAV